ncbi:MAG: RNA-directed DNA polymerase [Gammaproteobacteria bacterium]|nr:RNA-directed DNA polymerase [Gammaproteobacteria bacterium]
MPRIKDLFLELNGAKVFSKLDLRKGYYHIPLEKESRELTTTLTPLGLRQYRVLPMGLTDAASAFQRRMHQTLSGLPGVVVYIDDIIVFGKDQEEHDRNLRRVLQRLQDMDFRLQEPKCIFGSNSIPAFGHIISSTGITPDPKNLQPVLEAPEPVSVEGIQSFLGMINFYQDFLPDVASIAEPLRRLTRLGQKFGWTPECALSFKTLKAHR